MKVSMLANKKISYLLYKNPKCRFEIQIRNQLIYAGYQEVNGFIHCNLDTVWKIAYRAWFYGITIIGIESNIDQDVPFYDLCIEDYVDEIRNFGEDNPTQWIITALMPVIIMHPDIQLKFYVDIPEINIPVLEKTIEENLKD